VARAESFSVTRCSLVVRTIDAWTGRSVSGSDLQVYLDGIGSKPIRTSDGSFAFLDVGQPECELVILSSTYLEERLTIDLSTLPSVSPVVVVSLLPSRLYPAPPAGTGVELAVRDSSGRPLAGVSVAALVDDEGAVRGRLADDQAVAGATSLRYVPGSVRLQEGDVVALREKEGSLPEWCRIRSADTGECRLELGAPLARAWKRGTRLLAAALTRSDRDGSVIVPFRGRLPLACEAEAQLVRDGQTVAARWPAAGGRVTRPDPLVWPAKRK
jgi:hypothetical protein